MTKDKGESGRYWEFLGRKEMELVAPACSHILSPFYLPFSLPPFPWFWCQDTWCRTEKIYRESGGFPKGKATKVKPYSMQNAPPWHACFGGGGDWIDLGCEHHISLILRMFHARNIPLWGLHLIPKNVLPHLCLGKLVLLV